MITLRMPLLLSALLLLSGCSYTYTACDREMDRVIGMLGYPDDITESDINGHYSQSYWYWDEQIHYAFNWSSASGSRCSSVSYTW